MPGSAALLLCWAFLLSGCAGWRVFPHGINHAYLCAVRTARAHGYSIREQEFRPNSGTLVAARSVPDPRGTVISRGFFARTGEVLWNAWEHMKFDLGEGTGTRVRTEERVIVAFRATRGGLFGWLSWDARDSTEMKVTADVTDYAKADWVIKRVALPREYRETLYGEMAECLDGRMAAVAPSPVVAPSAPPREEPAPGGPPPEAPPEPGSDEAAAALKAGKQAYEAGKYREAVSILERVIAAEPDNAEALGYLGATYYQEHRLQDAVRAYERYLKLVPGDFRTREFVDDMKRRMQ